MTALPLDRDDPREVGRYRLTGRLGEGGQGVVYLGETPDGERVAVKMLKTTDAAARGRFAREMRAARQVAPFCTAAVLDSSAEGAHPYVVSEFIDGPSLQQRVAGSGPLRGGELERLAVNTASALAAIHGAGIVHRDLKPANVLLGPDGPRVVDFGIARAIDAETHTQLVGTPSYFAPEWLEGHPPTYASDVFAWAGTIVYAATGRPPFGPATSVPAIMHRIANGEPDLTGVPPSLHGLLAECLSKDPARRPTARDLMVRLVDPSGPDPRSVPAPPVPVPDGSVPPARDLTGPAPPPESTVGGGASGSRTPLIVAAAVVAVALIAAVTWIASSLLGKDDDDPSGRTARGGSSPSTGTDATGGTTPSTGGSSGGTSGSSGSSGSSGGKGGTAVPAAFGGTWKGTVVQKGGVILSDTSRTGATVTLTAGRSEGTADYDVWGCHNKVTVTSATGDRLELDETVLRSDNPTGTCVGGRITLTLAGGKLEYRSPGQMGGDSRGRSAGPADLG
ncbi:serine/threonine-protein kinase [Actinomadura yumaensis]|uniref:serine/threonine-protein kinase n=1 Tax=Actinomadura yumaensis TaxID=111807 RepID=UPI003623CA8B